MSLRALLTAVLVVLTVLSPGAASQSAGLAQLPSREDPDVLFRQREDLAVAARAAAIWKAHLAANRTDVDVANKLARVQFWLGERSPQQNRAGWYKDAMASASAAISIAPRRPEGHFWLGVSMGGLAGTSGVWAGLKYRTAIRKELETSLALDPTFFKGGAYCALGKYYNAMPGFLGGNKTKSEELLRRCLSADPASTVGHYYLAQTLVAVDRIVEARAELRAAIDAPMDPDNEPEYKVWKRRADRMLKRLEASK
jgi:tetratricopeptide (TPR) repeat protein